MTREIQQPTTSSNAAAPVSVGDNTTQDKINEAQAITVLAFSSFTLSSIFFIDDGFKCFPSIKHFRNLIGLVVIHTIPSSTLDDTSVICWKLVIFTGLP